MKKILNQLILFALLLLLSFRGFATNYYISGSSIGNDLNNGTSTSSPWKTITKLNNQNLVPGDSVFFQRGYTYRGMVWPKPGSSAKQIFYGAYGSGVKPIISGGVIIPSSGWTVYSGSIYVKTGVVMPSMADSESVNLYFNGKLMMPARFPNGMFLKADAVYGQNSGSNCCEQSESLKHTALSATFTNNTDLAGSHITGYSPYGVSTRVVKSYTPSTGMVYFDTLRGIGFMGSMLYFFSRKLNLIDVPGEWYYDAGAQKLYLWTPNGMAPSGSDIIERAKEDYGIHSWLGSYITVKDLDFRYQRQAGILSLGSPGVQILNNSFSHSKYGVMGWGGQGYLQTDTKIIGNTFDNIYRVAINIPDYSPGGGGTCNLNFTITDNVIRNIGINQALMQSGRGNQWKDYSYYQFGIGIQFTGLNSTVMRNRVDSVGKPAITAGGAGTVIKNNVMHCSCLNYNDCGALMPLGGGTNESNIIKDCWGLFQTGWYPNWGGVGIYPDFRVGDVIKNNTIINTHKGIGLVNSKNETVSGNTVYNSLLYGLRMGRATAGDLNNTIKKNIFFGLTHDQIPFMWTNDEAAASTDANSVVDSNRYWSPYSYYPAVIYKAVSTATVEDWYDLGQWKATGRDLKGKKEFLFKNTPYLKIAVNDSMIQNGRFTSGTTGWMPSNGVSLTTATGQLDGVCANINYPYAWNGFISQDIAKPFKKDSLYLIRFSLKGTASSNGDKFFIHLAATSATLTNVVYNRAFKNELNRKEYTSVYKAAADGTLTLQFFAPLGQYYIDNIQVYTLKANYIAPDKAFPIFVNETGLPMTVNLPPCSYLDLDSNAVGSSIVVGPYSSKILVLVKDSCMLTLETKEEVAKKPGAQLNVYPNPASHEFTMDIMVSETQKVSVDIFDLNGRQVLQILDTHLGAGPYSINIDAYALQPGVYLVRYIEGQNMVTKKLQIIR